MADCYQLHGHLTRPRLVPTHRWKYHYDRVHFHRLKGTALHLGQAWSLPILGRVSLFLSDRNMAGCLYGSAHRNVSGQLYVFSCHSLFGSWHFHSVHQLSFVITAVGKDPPRNALHSQASWRAKIMVCFCQNEKKSKKIFKVGSFDSKKDYRSIIAMT